MIKNQVENLINIYGKAWENQDSDLVLSIFTEDAKFYEPGYAACTGHAEIKKYWEETVLNNHKDISFSLTSLFLDQEANTAVAEYVTTFTDIKRNLKIKLESVGIYKIEGDKFSSLKEYYKSTKSPLE